jgi:hypothetical protein
MQYQFTHDTLLSPLRKRLSQPQWQNLLLLLLAVQLGRTLIGWQLALFWLVPISSASCYRRLERFFSWKGWKDETLQAQLQRCWVRAVLRCFAPGRGRLVLILDWTLHRDRCRSLWVMLPVGGRAVPVCFFLTGNCFGGEGAQRDFEDACLRQLKAWLPQRPVVLIGDRGFRGADRMHFLRQELGWDFVLRISGETMIQVSGTSSEWLPLRHLAPAAGGRWAHRRLVCGRTTRARAGTGRRVRVVANLVAVRQRLLFPKPARTNQGKRTGELVEETTWFLATSLPLGAAGVDIVELYQRRMQIEQTFRDFKSMLGMEREYTRQPDERLKALLWALTVGVALDLRLARPQPQASPPHRYGRGRGSVPEEPLRRYPRESATRAGLHQLLLSVVLEEGSLSHSLRLIASKSKRMQARPQVQTRRCDQPSLRNRARTRHVTQPT